MPRTRLYRKGVLVAEGFPIAEVSDHLADPAATVWFDLCAPDQAALDVLGEELGLHALALEDAAHPHERPKLDRYDTHLLLTATSVSLDAETGVLQSHDITAFIMSNAIVTVRMDAGFDIDDVMRRWDRSPDLAGHGPAYLLYGLLDHIVDTHFTAVQDLDSEIEALEDLLFEEHPKGLHLQRRTFQLRKALVTLRRYVLPMREVVNTLLRRDLHVMDPEMQPYFQDVYDHVLRATEWTESLRDLVTTILETNLSVRSNRLNLIMKQVTSWAAIIAVPTAVTGFYGENVPYPGFGEPAGFWMSVVMISVMASALYFVFRRKGWL